MNTKLLEIRDCGTCILALAIQMMALPASTTEKQVTPDSIEYWFLHYRSGYPEDGSSIMLMCLADGRATNDPYAWGSLGMGARTMPNAHNWIIEHWNELQDGDVVDVQFIRGETTVAKKSERLVPWLYQNRDETAYPHEPQVFTMDEYRRENSE